ncbi:MAG: cyclic nucleotide-binding domain-containing protein [Burkholderiaceae bacterium]
MASSDESEAFKPFIAARDVRRFVREFRAGQAVFNAGDHGTCMYVVLEGRVQIARPGRSAGGEGEVLAELGPGEFFGEMALVDNSTRMAAAIALTATRLAEIDRARFIYLVGQQPAFSLTVMRVLAQRLARAQAAPEEPT